MSSIPDLKFIPADKLVFFPDKNGGGRGRNSLLRASVVVSNPICSPPAIVKVRTDAPRKRTSVHPARTRLAPGLSVEVTVRVRTDRVVPWRFQILWAQDPCLSSSYPSSSPPRDPLEWARMWEAVAEESVGQVDLRCEMARQRGDHGYRKIQSTFSKRRFSKYFPAYKLSFWCSYTVALYMLSKVDGSRNTISSKFSDVFDSATATASGNSPSKKWSDCKGDGDDEDLLVDACAKIEVGDYVAATLQHQQLLPVVEEAKLLMFGLPHIKPNSVCCGWKSQLLLPLLQDLERLLRESESKLTLALRPSAPRRTTQRVCQMLPTPGAGAAYLFVVLLCFLAAYWGSALAN